jgi:hypothetical protein
MGFSRGILAVVIVGVLVGCSATAVPLDPVWVSGVDPASRPGFLDTEQLPDDVPAGGLDGLPIDPASTRFQGEYGGSQYFLGTGHDGLSVYTLINDPNDPTSWAAGTGGGGNSPVGTGPWIGDDDDTLLVYLPQGTDNPPEGWDVFSEWMVIRS